jgi:hypothetical protein
MREVVTAYDYLRDRYLILGAWVDAYELQAEPRRWWRLLMALRLMAAFPWLWAAPQEPGGE